MIQATSLQAYFGEVILTLGDRQKAVLEALSKRDNFTNNELAQYLNWPINTITPRIFELRERNLVRESVKRPCRVSGRTAIAWEVVDPENKNKRLF